MTLPRRALVAGGAWAAPALLATATIPAYAASVEARNAIELEKSLQGQLRVNLTCRVSSFEFTLMGVPGQTAQQTFYIGGAKETSVITAPSFTFYLPSQTVPTLTWRPIGTVVGWSTPAVDASAPAIPGFTAYTMRYTLNNWSYDATLSRHYIPHLPAFSAVVNSRSCPTNFQVHSLRQVTVDGKLYQFRIGPAWLRSQRG